MAKHILYCKDCKIYTMELKCPKCDKKTVGPAPAKYSPDDPYGVYRRKAKKEVF